MSPQLRRYLPLILIAVFAIFILPQLLNRGKKSSTLSEKDRATLTQDAFNRIDRAETAHLAKNGKYTAHLADLAGADEPLVSTLTVPLTVDLDVSADGKTYLLQVSSDVISLAGSRTGGKVGTASCRVLKSRSSITCPPGTTTSGTTTTTPTTTTG
jgi:hypothetical protein